MKYCVKLRSFKLTNFFQIRWSKTYCQQFGINNRSWKFPLWRNSNLADVEVGVSLHGGRGEFVVEHVEVPGEGGEGGGKLFMQTQHAHTLSTVAIQQSEHTALKHVYTELTDLCQSYFRFFVLKIHLQKRFWWS